MDIAGELANLSEADYRDFSVKLIPNARILGVRTPALRNLAKKLVRIHDFDEIVEILNSKKSYHEEVLLDGFIINSLKGDEKIKIELSKNYLPKITNWALCDAFAEVKRRDLELWREYILDFSGDDREFYARYFYVFWFKNFKESSDFEIFLSSLRKSEFYYVKMAMAWGICEYAGEYEMRIYEFLRDFDDEATKKLAVKKIKESLKFSKISKYKFSDLV